MSSKIFNLPTQDSQLSTNEGITQVWYDRINPQRSVSSTGSFTQGLLNWTWESASGVWWLPSKSYFEMTVEYLKTGAVQPNASDGVGPALNAMANLFQTLSFSINDKDICNITDYVAQCDTILKRIYNSDSFIKNGYSNEFWDSFGLRVNKISANGLEVFSNDGTPLAGTCSTMQQNDVVIQWRPMCLGIFRVEEAMPANARFRLSAQPYSTNLLGNAYESKSDTVKPVDPNIQNLVFFAAHVQGPRWGDVKDTYMLDLKHITCQARPVSGSGLSSNQFDIPPTTYALSLAYQTTGVAIDPGAAVSLYGIVGKSTLRGKFNKAAPYLLVNTNDPTQSCAELGVKRVYINYGSNKVYPTSDLNLNYNGKIGSLAPLYALTQSQIDASEDPSGGETMENFFQRGWYMHVDTPKDATDLSTRVQVNQDFSTAGVIASDLNALLFAHFKTVVTISAQGGRVTDVAISYD